MKIDKMLGSLFRHLRNIVQICLTGHFYNYHLYSELVQIQNNYIKYERRDTREVGTSMYDLPLITVDTMEDGERKNSRNWINYNFDLLTPAVGSSATESEQDSDSSDELNYNALGQKNSEVSQYFTDEESEVPALVRRWSVAVDNNLRRLNNMDSFGKPKRRKKSLSALRPAKIDENRDELYARVSDLLQALSVEKSEASELSDDDIKALVSSKQVSITRLEQILGNLYRAVLIRREIVEADVAGNGVYKIPFNDYDYSKIYKCCVENCIGYVQVPVGIAGPNVINGKPYRIPMATTEGCLVASTNRGCQALRLSGGVNVFITKDCMTRGPFVEFASAKRAVEAYTWLQTASNYDIIRQAFESTSNYSRLVSIGPRVVGRYLFMRFTATTGNAMGMNMVSKATDKALTVLSEYFPDMVRKCLSGNLCTDKKASLVNWTEGRGKSVVGEAHIPGHIVGSILKTSVEALVQINKLKNMVGSSLTGTIGGYNAHAANVVAAMFIATGQDAAQVVGSSNCITAIEPFGLNGEDLYICCTLPSVEVGCIGGGTGLESQRGCLELLNLENDSARELSKVICGTVIAAELSLMASLAEGSLVESHLKNNRRST